ncbi:Pyridoxal-dependent decarboxylase [Crocosphaera watsonii WH 0401]|uniref:Pyridoxal-dependent decarboxylase n=1 Tax=Crocosphaera watsonii WH 0401 TaxID=555881 RepID=T2J4T6_CROWT|nr:Pyridoxal-dependent decarboxylase [Crocosphaera watsonii WH 0401]
MLIEQGIYQAQYFARKIDKLKSFELILEPTLNIVNYRYIPDYLRDKLEKKC